MGSGEARAQITPRRHALDAVLKGISSRYVCRPAALARGDVTLSGAQRAPVRPRGDAAKCGPGINRVEAARAASRERVKAKHGERREKQLFKAEALIHSQSKQIASLQARLKSAERAANSADGDRAMKRGKAGLVVHRGEKLYHVMHSPGVPLYVYIVGMRLCGNATTPDACPLP